jgi:hypothetical protein
MVALAFISGSGINGSFVFPGQERLPAAMGSTSAEGHCGWKPLLRAAGILSMNSPARNDWPYAVREIDCTDKLMPAIGLESGYWNLFGMWWL